MLVTIGSVIAAFGIGSRLVSAQRAGNEDYWLQARASLPQSPQRRSDSSWSLTPQSVSFTAGNETYLSPTGEAFKSYTLDADWGLSSYSDKAMLVTVVNVEGQVTCDTLSSKLAEYSKSDDVWNESFLEAMVLSTSSSFNVDSDVASCAEQLGTSLIVKNGNATSELSGIGLALVNGPQVPNGPYFATFTSTSVTLSEVYLIYRDEQQAFTTAVIQTTSGTFVDLSTPVLGLNTLSIPVPSKLYTLNSTSSGPLAGKRIAVKDLYDLAGVKTGGGSRAYFNTYPPRTKNAYPVQILVDQGAIIVGRAKTSQFANGESATADWVDQMCPFNPRGDGYQQPSSSSSGPGAAIAAYDWLDYTVGSDTGGSIVDPAMVQGVYGLRPTWGALSLEGVIPLQATQDTAGFFARDAVMGSTFAKAWYGDRFKNYTTLPPTLILPNSTWTFDDDFTGTQQFESYRQSLVDFVKPKDIDTRSFDDFWNETGYLQKADDMTIDSYLNTTYANLIGYYQYENFGKPWIQDYMSQNDGRMPFIDPNPLVRWTYAADNVSAALFNESLAQKALWEEFAQNQVLKNASSTCSSAIYVEPFGLGSTDYRNVYFDAPSPPFGFGYPAQFGGFPQLVVPIGQISYNSTITQHVEYLPLTVTMYAAAGCDYVLWDLAAGMQQAGLTSVVEVGRSSFMT